MDLDLAVNSLSKILIFLDDFDFPGLQKPIFVNAE